MLIIIIDDDDDDDDDDDYYYISLVAIFTLIWIEIRSALTIC